MSEMLFKMLGPNGTPHHGGSGTWPLPTAKRPGKWIEVAGPIVPCRHGLHLCDADHLLDWAAPELYVAEASGERFVQKAKIVVARARLIRRVVEWNDVSLRLFAADCAERALLREREMGREPGKRSWDAVRIARDFANGQAMEADLAAAWAAARDAVGAAAWAAARDAAWAAAGAAARDAVGAAAWAAARDAAWDAAGDAAWDAAAVEKRWQNDRLLCYLNLDGADS